MKKIIFVLLVLNSLFAFSQDTIAFRDKPPIAAKITEVGVRSIKYYRWDNQNGPMYDVSKDQISYISFAGGHREFFKAEASIQPQIAPPAKEKIVILNRRFLYRGKTLTDQHLLYLLEDHKCDPELKKNLLDQYATMISWHYKARLLINFAFFTLVASPLTGAATRKLYGEPAMVPISIGAGGVLAIMSGFLMQDVFQKKLEMKRQIVNMYNATL
jgi:hypothetical protein